MPFYPDIINEYLEIKFYISNTICVFSFHWKQYICAYDQVELQHMLIIEIRNCYTLLIKYLLK